ncbi:molybdopterin cofactor-binding domain-containing protein [Qipengyuania vesicularis]|uniref:molybdopterin cofactor-binding domain-containing protein n=1 Tax=Qipengyuania vesicularis TaxID=2867232 RepID=UPI001C87C015|nr:molybdopterin cofactor-binding domain-containing protein [Qipengyuania vesicularis]MBX7527818.1 molybdopterin-dependent oxidoreductase [Qipengyuania vesicularis]
MDIRERLSGIEVSRRKVLAGAAAGGGLLLAWTLWPRDYRSPLTAREGAEVFGGWLTIGRDGVVTVAMPQLEMGQGIGTLLAQIAATELGADWRQVGIDTVPPAGHFANLPLAAEWSSLWEGWLGAGDEADDWSVGRFARRNDFSATAAGTSLAAYELPLREAAASARDMLTRAAAENWDVPHEQCQVVEGFVIHERKRLPFGELVDRAVEFDPPDPPPLRPDAAFEEPLPGEGDAPTLFPRLDLPSKVDGSHLFSGDVRLPGMVYASVRHGPIGLPELLPVDEARVQGTRGLLAVVKSKRWIAAVAESWWIADQALARLRPQFTGPGALDQSALEAQMERVVAAGEETAERIETIGEPDGYLADPTIVRRYDVAAAPHLPLETATATARYADGQLELWIASQAPAAARDAAAEAIGISPSDVILYPMPAGGSFDARLEKQHAIEVAQIAEQVGRPVQLTWSRPQDMQMAPYRAPVVGEVAATLGAQGQPVAMRTRIISPSWMRETGHRLFDNYVSDAAKRESSGEGDPFVVEGGVPPYNIAHIAVDHVPADIALPTGRMRGGAQAYTGFITESFVDELARNAGRDPYLYRMAMLTGAPRMAECLQRATRLGDWSGATDGSGEGIAMVRMGRDPANAGHIACVAHVSRGEGGIRVRQLSAVADIGRIVNLDIARQQIEGGLLFGMGLALGAPLQFDTGHPVPRTLGEMNLPGLSEAPDILIDFVSSEAEPFDPGELGVAIAPPAIANALFALTGERSYRLPLGP